MRIDKYLKISRLIKRRTVAFDACKQGRVFINGKSAKPSSLIKEGDIVKILFGNSTTEVRILSISYHVSKDLAKELYEVL